MNELDLLKKDWQKNSDSFTPIPVTELYKMLHQKSSSIVKRIFIISIIEILFWASISVFSNTDDYLKNNTSHYFVALLKWLEYINYGIILVFIYLFYKNYRLISATVSTKKLMTDILKTRKTVQIYVGYNLGMVVLSIVFGFYVALCSESNLNSLENKVLHNDVMDLGLLLGVLFLTIAVALGIFWLFYKLLYGILLQKLNTNYKELQKIED